MNHCGIQQNSNFSSFGGGETVVCPKPRRLSRFNAAVNEPVRPFRWQMCNQQEPYEPKPGADLLDLMLPDQVFTPIASSPPFFCGSPPSRVSNPLIQDARFGDDKISPISPKSMIPNPSSGMVSPSRSRLTGPSFGNKPSVRIEGFNCLDRDTRRNCRIPALA